MAKILHFTEEVNLLQVGCCHRSNMMILVVERGLN